MFATAIVPGITLPRQSAGGNLFVKVDYICSGLSHLEELNFHCQQNYFIPVCVLTRPNLRDRKGFGYF